MSTQIPGIKHASPAFLKVIASCVTMPQADREHDWQKLYKTGEGLFYKDISRIQLTKMLPFENKKKQLKDYIDLNLPQMAHLYLASRGYRFAIDMSFLNTTLSKKGLVVPAFALLDAHGEPNFGLSISRRHLVVSPFAMHYVVQEMYSEALQKMQNSLMGATTQIMFQNAASPPVWAREMIEKARSTGLFRKIYIVVDHTQDDWDTTSDLFTTQDLAELERIHQEKLNASFNTPGVRRGGKVRRGEFKDPLIVGEHHFTFSQRPFGTHTIKMYSLIAVYDHTELEEWVIHNHVRP